MTDDEYKEFLAALAEKHLRPDGLSPEGTKRLRSELRRLIWICKLNELVRTDPQDRELLKGELASQLAESPMGLVADSMEAVGIMDALDEAPEIVFENLRLSVVPEQDIDLFRQAGFAHPEAEITIITARGLNRYIYWPDQPNAPSAIVRHAADTLRETGGRLREPREQPPPRKRKLFTGIGKILGGAIAGAGNVLLACGTLVAPNPATGYSAIASGALAVAGVFQGIGDLRGE